MTDYELYSLFYDVGATAETYTDRYMALLFAFLIAAYLVGGKLDRFLANIVIALYSAMAIRYGLIFYNIAGDAIALSEVLRQRAAEPGSALDWLEIGPVSTVYDGVLVLYFLSYLVSLAFFAYIRRRTGQ